MRKVLDYNITGHDTDYYRCISPTSYLKIAETACFIASETEGMLMQRMIDEMQATWMTASFQLEIFKDIFYVGPVEVFVEPFIKNGAVFTRTGHILRGGVEIARFHVNTMAVNFHTRKVMPPELVADRFGVAYVVASGAPARLGMPNDMEKYEEYIVRYSDCDHNQHLRAYEYVNLICDAAEYWTGSEREKKGRVLNVEFLGECKAGETLTISRKFTPEAVYIAGTRPDGKTSFKAYFVME